MTQDYNRQVLRLPKKHAAKALAAPDPAEGEQLFHAQSIRNAIVAGLIVIVFYSAAWSLLSTAIQRVFPWLAVVQGVFVGLAVRHAGRGLDWRFPTIAVVLATMGALAGYIVVAAAFTAVEFGTGTIAILRGVTAMTWPVFFDEVMTSADIVYALSAGIAGAFYANRRLSRTQYLAYRIWLQGNKPGTP